MPYYSIDDPRLEVAGALAQLHQSDGSFRIHRLPADTIDRLPTEGMGAMVASSAGVRIRFRTSARRIALIATFRLLEIVDLARYGAKVDLTIDGELVGSQEVEGGTTRISVVDDVVTMDSPPPTTTVFDGLPEGHKLVELWLPQTAVTDLFGVETDEPVAQTDAAEAGNVWLHHGSSISHCLEAGTPTSTWPAVAARELRLPLLNLGFAGNAMLDPFVARTIRDTPASLISVKVGINLVNADLMRARAFGPALDGWLDTIRDGHPTTPLILISPIVCPAHEQVPGPTLVDPETGVFFSSATEPYSAGALTLGWIRDQVRDTVMSRSGQDDRLFYVDGRLLFGQSDVEAGLLPDGLHPNDAGYRLMGERFAREVRSLGVSTSPASSAPPGQ